MSNRYWIASSDAAWNSSSNWSASSGGSGGASVPSSGDFAFFDASGQGGCLINSVTTVGTLNSQGDHTGRLHVTSDLTSETNLILEGGYFSGSDATIFVRGDMTVGSSWGRFGDASALTLMMDAATSQSFQNTMGGIIPTLVVNKQTADYVTCYGTGPIQINGDFLLWDGTVNTNTVNIVAARSAGIIG